MSGHSRFKLTRRRLLTASGAALSGALLSPARAFAQDAARRHAGTRINVACWTAPYAKWRGLRHTASRSWDIAAMCVPRGSQACPLTS